MYGALDENGQRVGNPIKSSLIGEWAGLPNIERKCTADRDYLRDLERRKALAERIRRVVADCQRRGDSSQPEIERRLSEAGISAVFRHNDDGRLTGATFIDHRGKNVYNGSNLGKDLSANSWNALFNEARPQLGEQERQSPEVASRRPEDQERTTPPSRQQGERTIVADTATGTPTFVSDSLTEYGDEFDYEMEFVPQTDRHISTERATDNHHGHDIFRGLSRQGSPYEEIDPEFRLLYKRKKKRGRKR